VACSSVQPLQRLAAARLSGRHQSPSDGTLRRCLHEAGSSVLDHIQTGADLFSAENIDNRVNEREQSHKDERHDDPDSQGSRRQDSKRPPDQPDGREGGQGLGGSHPEPQQEHGALIPGQEIHSRRYRHEGKSKERQDRPEILDRPDELPRIYAEARQVAKQEIQPIQSDRSNRQGGLKDEKDDQRDQERPETLGGPHELPRVHEVRDQARAD